MVYREILEKNKAEMLEKLQELVRIRSVRTEPCRSPEGEVYPFGAGVEEAYQYTLKLGKELGFEVKDWDHYCGHIEWKSENPDAQIFGIAGHLDIVPEGDGWTFDPYAAEIADGWMLGRGTLDDKGPVIACLYGMKALKEAGYRPADTIRLILGLDEETGRDSVHYYLEKDRMPDYGITPDGEFPLTNGEMGNMKFQLASRMKKYSPKEGLVLSKIDAGLAPNIVPRTAKAVVASGDSGEYDTIRTKAEAFAEETGYNLKTRKVGTSLAIEATGISAHGADPHKGLNAISILMAFLGRLDFVSDEVTEWIRYYNEHIGFNLHGENMECAFQDEPSGKLICNVGMMELSNDVATVTLNVRYPISYTSENVYEGVEKTLEGTNIGLIKKGDDKPAYVPVDDPFIQTLCSVYVEETGDDENKPFVDRGGTYAKVFRRMVAFGALFPGEEDRMHQPDERLSIEALMKMTRIYTAMMEKLCMETEA